MPQPQKHGEWEIAGGSLQLVTVQAFVDSAAAADFLDFDLAQSLGIEPVPLEEPIGICTLDGTLLKEGLQDFARQVSGCQWEVSTVRLFLYY